MPECAEVHGFVDVVNSASGKLFKKVWKSEVHKGEDFFSSIPFALFSISALARGKEAIVTITNANNTKDQLFFLFRFGMTGSFERFEPGVELPKHSHVVFEAEDGTHVCFVDQRRFGRWERCAHASDWGEDRGPDPVDEYEAFCYNVVDKITPKSKYWSKPIVEVLLLQELFNGIGNYLRSEILHEAGVKDPFTKAGVVFSDLTKENCKKNRILELCREIPLRFMEKKKYSDADFLEACKVYQKTSSLSRKDSSGRMVWWAKDGKTESGGESDTKKNKKKTKEPSKKKGKKEEEEVEESTSKKKKAPSKKRSKKEEEEGEGDVVEEKKTKKTTTKKRSQIK